MTFLNDNNPASNIKVIISFMTISKLWLRGILRVLRELSKIKRLKTKV